MVKSIIVYNNKEFVTMPAIIEDMPPTLYIRKRPVSFASMWRAVAFVLIVAVLLYSSVSSYNLLNVCQQLPDCFVGCSCVCRSTLTNRDRSI